MIFFPFNEINRFLDFLQKKKIMFIRFYMRRIFLCFCLKKLYDDSIQCLNYWQINSNPFLNS